MTGPKGSATVVAIALAGVCAAPACSPYRVTHDPAPPIAMPAAYRGAAQQRAPSGQAGQQNAHQGAQPETWWQDFDDATLDDLVQRALRDNFQLRSAWARVEQARALVTQAHSGKYPQLTYTASAARQKSRFNFQGEITVQTNQFSGSIAAAYEVDLWRRIANQGDAAALSALAFRDDVEAIAITLASQVTEAWFDLIAHTARRTLLREQLATNETYLELTQLRFEKGLASALDVYQQKQQIVATRAQLTLIESAIALFQNQLAVLVGVPPANLEPLAEKAASVTQRSQPGSVPDGQGAPGEPAPPSKIQLVADLLPAMPPLPGLGLPADLLERRPDVRAARRRVEAADYQVAVAVADRLPSLRLNGSTSLQSEAVADFIASPLWSIIAAVTGPIFDGGRRKAEVERQKAVVKEALMGYGQVMIQAMTEVENALVQEKQQLLYIVDLEEALTLAGATLREAQERYRQGLIDYLPVLTALEAEQRSQINLLLARRQLLSHRVQLCRALGGTWTQTLQEPERKGESS